MRAALLILLVSTLVGIPGCANPTAVGYWSQDAYYPSRSHYRVFFDGTADSRVLAAGWTATAFAREDGRATTALGHIWSHTRRYDYDPSDSGRSRSVTDEAHDLSLLHADGSRIESWTEPVTRRIGRFDLGEVAVALAAASTNAHLDLTIAEHARVEIDGEQGHQVFFEVRDNRPVASGIVRMPLRSCLVVVRPRRLWVPGGSVGYGGGMTMFVFFMLTADADVFDARYAEFESLLGRVDFRDMIGE